MLLAACTKPSPAPAPAPEHFSKYIFFSHSVETKAPLVESAGDIGTFGVVGFKYDSNTDWAKYSTTTVNGKLPTPNVFYDPVTDPATKKVTNELVNVETVSVDGTTAKYTPLQGWSNNKKYAFFAFYPMPNANVTLANLDGSTPYAGGAPAVKYTMDAPAASTEGAADGTAFKASMIDVITADHIDQYWTSEGKSFTNTDSDDFVLNFKHRLSALGVSITNSSSGDIEIKSLTLTISGIKYLSTIIPLDGSAQTPEELAEEKKVPETTFTINIADDEKSIATKSTEPTKIKDNLIFIPQTQNISINLSMVYTDPYSDSDITKVITDLTTPLDEGKQHMVQLNYVDYNTFTVTIDGWDTPNNSIDHEFN